MFKNCVSNLIAGNTLTMTGISSKSTTNKNENEKVSDSSSSSDDSDDVSRVDLGYFFKVYRVK